MWHGTDTLVCASGAAAPLVQLGVFGNAVVGTDERDRFEDEVVGPISSRSSLHHPGADRCNEAAVDRLPSAWRDREALEIRVLLRAREDFAAGLSFLRLLLVFNNAFLLLFCKSRPYIGQLTA